MKFSPSLRKVRTKLHLPLSCDCESLQSEGVRKKIRGLRRTDERRRDFNLFSRSAIPNSLQSLVPLPPARFLRTTRTRRLQHCGLGQPDNNVRRGRDDHRQWGRIWANLAFYSGDQKRASNISNLKAKPSSIWRVCWAARAQGHLTTRISTFQCRGDVIVQAVRPHSVKSVEFTVVFTQPSRDIKSSPGLPVNEARRCSRPNYYPPFLSSLCKPIIIGLTAAPTWTCKAISSTEVHMLENVFSTQVSSTK